MGLCEDCQGKAQVRCASSGQIVKPDIINPVKKSECDRCGKENG